MEQVYILKHLTDGLVKIPDIPDNLKKQVIKLHKNLGQKEFFKKLIKLDPLAKNFVYRLMFKDL